LSKFNNVTTEVVCTTNYKLQLILRLVFLLFIKTSLWSCTDIAYFSSKNKTSIKNIFFTLAVQK